jgi:hypothetical protein
MNTHSIASQPPSPIPPDDLERRLVIARPGGSPELPHIGLAGGTYTLLLTGNDTDGRYCLIDMIIPPGGGPPPHRHDFEESFTILEGEIEATFRGQKSLVGIPLDGSSTASAHPDPAAQAASRARATELAPKYRTEFLKP